MTEFTFIVKGKMIGKERPKVVSRKINGKIIKIGITPKKTRDYEKLIQKYYISQKKKNLNFIKNSPFVITIDCYYKVPDKIAKWKKIYFTENRCQPTTTPDGDNVLKSVLDALNNIAYNDDMQCVGFALGKSWAKPNEDEYIKVTLSKGDGYTIQEIKKLTLKEIENEI